MHAVVGLVPIITNADLYDATSIEYGMSNWLEPLHLIQRLQYSRIFQIHQSEGRDVHRVVLEVLQVERLYVLQNQSACSLGTVLWLYCNYHDASTILLYVFFTHFIKYTYSTQELNAGILKKKIGFKRSTVRNRCECDVVNP